LSASSCCRPVSSAIDVPFLISQILRECEKGDLADFSILSCLDSEPDSKVLVEKLIASRLSFLKNQKGIQSVQDELMSFVEKLQETLSSDPSIIGVNFRDNVKAARPIPGARSRLQSKESNHGSQETQDGIGLSVPP